MNNLGILETNASEHSQIPQQTDPNNDQKESKVVQTEPKINQTESEALIVLGKQDLVHNQSETNDAEPKQAIEPTIAEPEALIVTEEQKSDQNKSGSKNDDHQITDNQYLLSRDAIIATYINDKDIAEIQNGGAKARHN